MNGEPPDNALLLRHPADSTADPTTQSEIPAQTGASGPTISPGTGTDVSSTHGSSSWRRWWRPVATGVVLGSAIATSLLAAEPRNREVAPAETPPGCRGAHCTGKDPESQGCTHTEHEPATVAERSPAGKVRMDIRHSKGCDAAWARVWLTEVGTRIALRSPEGDTQEAFINDRHDAQGYVHTPMLGGHPPEQIEACFHPPDTSGKGRTSQDPVCFTPSA